MEPKNKISIKKIVLIGLAILFVALGLLIFLNRNVEPEIIEKIVKVKEKPLLKYSYENLSKTKFEPSDIEIGDVLKTEEDYTSQMFYFKLNNSTNGKNGTKRISGLMNLPAEEGIYPVVLLIRGFVDPENYTTGVGTQRVGEVLAQNGFITLAPDFLGYGQSDNVSENSIQDRFQTYTSTITLLSSLVNLNSAIEASYSGKIKADISKVGVWGHSNGGQIAISTLEITGKDYPTVLWAPVSKPFPYSVLYFTDEFEDHGKALRKVIADFEKDYDIEMYSPSNYYSWINAPIEIHQGTADDSVPLRWSDNLVTDLEALDKEVSYFTYPGADHNLMPAWNDAVKRTLDFYKSHL